MGTVVALPRQAEVVTKQQLARMLGVSERRIEQLAQRGMPKGGKDRRGRRLYPVDEVKAWLNESKGETEKPRTVTERLARLEAQVASLDRRLSVSGKVG